MSVFTSDVIVENTSPIPVSGPLTDAELRAAAVPVTIPTPVPVTDNGSSLTVDGTVSISGSVAVTGPLTDAQLRATPVPVSGSVSTTPTTSNSATVAQVTSNSSNQTLLAANANRKKAILFFSSGIWYVKFGATASNTSFTYLVNTSNTTIEVPMWVGQIDALCTTSNKLVNITEMV